jgi:hypothetical protein
VLYSSCCHFLFRTLPCGWVRYISAVISSSRYSLGFFPGSVPFSVPVLMRVVTAEPWNISPHLGLRTRGAAREAGEKCKEGWRLLKPALFSAGKSDS